MTFYINSYGFLFWEHFKKYVFTLKSRTVKDMILIILDACQVIESDKDLCSRVSMSVRSRIEKYVNANGKQFEYLRY